ncbi:AlpA family transcriptional regulator [Streptomyces sp. AJS327]|uniref:helix-turn-helix transcriptional regulator n=1 Tax=Streptomyces sp. AJS327 TaxID=2545265 RepID=UPI001C60E1DD|nr:helix-turn-helix domain-containing protein [Streptomyces sp. AJS327]
MATSSRTRRAPKDELIPLPEVLAELGITRPTWYRWRDRGFTPEARRTPSGRICVLRSALDAFKEELEVA